MHKKYLVAPGPTPVPDSVLLEIAKPIIHHRTEGFENIMAQVLQDLKWIYQTKKDVLILTSSGTGAMEASIVNTLSPGDKVITVEGGKFGERWTKISSAYGLNPIPLKVKWGTTCSADDIKKLLHENKDVKAVMIQACETSTAVSFPIKEISETVSKTDAILIVDGITGVGVDDIKFDEWKIDVLISGSQKAFMTPPGLAFIALSDKAWKMTETSKCPKYYFNLKTELKNQLKNTTAWTPGISLIIGLSKAFDIIKKQGLEDWFKKNAVLAEATREGAKAMGLKVFAKMNPSNALTAIELPETIEGKKVSKIMQNIYGVTAAGGQDELAGKIVRIGHLGYIDPSDIIVTLQRLEWTLADLGYKINFGLGLGAAQEVFYKNKELFYS